MNFIATGRTAEATLLGNWFRGHGTRETIESILIAILLALLFRYFEAEAFVIPTGSMAPDLQGQHIDVSCPECGFQYLAGATEGNDERTNRVKSVICPMCRFELELEPHQHREHQPFSGDRILVNKFAYDFAPPERYDVIVFKYPNNGKQNFIKRLIGLPNEGMLIEKGDIYAWKLDHETFADRAIARKDPTKLNAMLMIVDDTHFFPAILEESGWPSLWSEWSAENGNESWNRERSSSDEPPVFTLSPTDSTRWLRYRHIKPRPADWQAIARGDRPERMAGRPPSGELIVDHYAYNDTTVTTSYVDKVTGQYHEGDLKHPNGMHWTGDTGLRAWVEIGSGNGVLALQTVEGGVAFTCKIDVATGKAAFTAIGDVNGDSVQFSEPPVAETPIRGKGSWDIQFVNADDRLYLWVNGTNIEIQGAEYRRTGPVVPVWRQNGPSDSEPLGIGGQNLELQVTRLQVFRDIYYTSKNNTAEKLGRADRAVPAIEYRGFPNVAQIEEVLRNPEAWNSPVGQQMFAARDRGESYAFRLGPHQLLPMGDNSPQSNDARIWDGARYINDSYLLGKALFIYWPHARTTPLPFWPNFERMGFIR